MSVGSGGNSLGAIVYTRAVCWLSRESVYQSWLLQCFLKLIDKMPDDGLSILHVLYSLRSIQRISWLLSRHENQAAGSLESLI